MNINSFLNNYQISENPFRAEEARHDTIFTRIETDCFHPDFEKICGDFDKPATSIVFGERGSGKTAIRLQIEDRIRQHNRDHPENRCLAVSYDELNPVLDRFRRHIREKSDIDTLRRLKLVDHIDAIMNAVVPRIVDQALGKGKESGILQLNESAHRALRRLDKKAKRDLLLVQLCYDNPDTADARTARFKRAIHYRTLNRNAVYQWFGGIGAILGIGGGGYFLVAKPQEYQWLWLVAIGVLLAFAGVMAWRITRLWWKTRRIAHDLAKSLRVMDRPSESFRASLASLGGNLDAFPGLPVSRDDDLRYAMFDRLLNVLKPLGYTSLIVLVDRVDEPTMINGEPERMKAFVWPMLNNKFLQQDRVGFKLLLPLELRHLLNRETAEFFREARLDKQNLIERLTWSGATLYDLCSARLRACRPNGEEAISLSDLFDEDVGSQMLIDALDQMQQPRDAFKLIYQLIQEHCANVPDEHPRWKIPRPVLDSIRKREVERMSGMLRGVRPA